jgi:secreted trypsin-like serine protease
VKIYTKKMKLLAFTILCIVAATAHARSSFIINGQDSAHVPFYAYIEIFRHPNQGGPTMYFGGGSLISQSLVLTVAQNTVGFQSWRVGLGANRISAMQWSTSSFARTHPTYNPATLADNVAVIQLSQPVVLVPNVIATVSLLPNSASFPGEFDTLEVFGFGFGLTDEQPELLQRTQVLVTNQQNCEFSYPHLHHTQQIHNYFCARNDITSSNICAGDQGGPVYHLATQMQVGIQSFYRVSNCGLPEAQPGAFIRTARYAHWINEVFQGTYNN